MNQYDQYGDTKTSIQASLQVHQLALLAPEDEVSLLHQLASQTLWHLYKNKSNRRGQLQEINPA